MTRVEKVIADFIQNNNLRAPAPPRGRHSPWNFCAEVPGKITTKNPNIWRDILLHENPLTGLSPILMATPNLERREKILRKNSNLNKSYLGIKNGRRLFFYIDLIRLVTPWQITI